MAVQPQTPYIEHVAEGTAKSFNIDFDCKDKDHLIVLVDDNEPAVGDWILDSGAVIFKIAPKNGAIVKVQRNTPFKRDRDYQSYDNSFRPPAVNKDFDWIWLKLQELGVADYLQRSYVDKASLEQKKYTDEKNEVASSYFIDLIGKQGVSIQHLDQFYQHLIKGMANISKDKGWLASLIAVSSGRSQQEINDLNGIDYWFEKSYQINNEVRLLDGNVVRSTVENNFNNPNFDMSGWVNVNDASQIIDLNGINQQQFNDSFNLSSKYPTTQEAISKSTPRSILTIPTGEFSGNLIGNNADFIGTGYATRINIEENSYGFFLKQSIPNWEKRFVKNMSIHGGFDNRTGIGVTFDPDDSGSGRWNLEYIGFQNLDIGIYKPAGNIGNTYSNISVELANYGYRAKSGVNMHSGSDLIRDSHFRYIDVWSVDLQNDVDGFGQFTIDNTIFEGSTGGGIRIDCGNIVPYAPITIKNCWFELIATAETVNRDGVEEIPRHIKLIDTPVAFIELTYFYNIELINSNLIADKCRIDSGATGRIDLILDADSSLTVTNLITQGSVGRVPLIKSIASANPIWTQNNTLRGEATKGTILDASPWGGIVKKANSFTGTVGVTTWSLNSIKGAYTTSCVDDGLLSTGAMRLVLESASEATLPAAFNVTANKWYVWGLDIKQIGGDGVAAFAANSDLSKTMFGDIYFEYNKWTSNFGISQSTTTETALAFYVGSFSDAPLTVEMQNFFIVEFEKERDALEFVNSRFAISRAV